MEQQHQLNPLSIFEIKFPNEILAKIFAAGTDTWRDDQNRDLPFPILISEVCGHWRTLAQSTPELWNFILPPLHGFLTPEAGSCWTSRWLHRSGALPLTIVIDDRLWTRIHGQKVDSKAVITSVLASIESHTHRLRRIDIWCDYIAPNDVHHIFQFPHLLLNLQQISVCLQNISASYYLNTLYGGPLDYLIKIPGLRKLRLSGVIAPMVSNLTSLAIHSFSAIYENIQAIFATSPNLKTLVLYQLLPLSSLPPSQNPTIIAASLQAIAVSLEAQSFRDRVATYLPNLLIMPNLKHIEIDGEISVSSVFGSALSICNIESLRISNQPLGSPRISHVEAMADIKFLRSLRSIHRLELIQASGEGLLSDIAEVPRALTRTRSINFRPSLTSSTTITPGETSQAAVHWPDATTIALDTLSAKEVMHLCRFVKSHKSIQTIFLPRNAIRHLSESLVRNHDLIYEKSTVLGRHHDDQGTKDVFEWLSSLVRIVILEKPIRGMLDGEKYPLWEIE